jgi:Phage portal protein
VRLLDRLSRRDSGYWEGMASGAAILTSTYGSADREAILPQVAGWAQQANASDSPVFAAELVRMMLLSEAQFQFQAKDDKHLYGNTTLSVLEHPWPGGTSGELIARMEQDAGLAGNSYTWNVPDEDLYVRLRPDWTVIVSELVPVPNGTNKPGYYRKKIGLWWEPPKSVLDQGKGFFIPIEEIAHWAPIPDPQANFRGMSWLTPVYRDINADSGMVQHKIKYLENSATPNITIRYPQKLSPASIDAVRERMTARYGGTANAYKTLVLDQGADLTLVGDGLAKMDFANVAQAGVERILAAAGVPPLLVGL